MTFNPQRPVVSQPLGRISNYQKVASYAQQLQASTIQNGVDPKAIAEAEVAAIQLATFVRIEEIPDTPGQQGMLKEMKELMAEMQMKLDRRLTTIDTKLDTFATLEVLENRFTTIDMKLDTFATLQALDTRLDGTNAHFGRLEKKVEDMKTKLGVLNDLEENIRELANQVSSNKKLASSVLITAIQALNGSCDNGLLRNYQEVPFPDGTYPSHVDVASRNVQGQFPLIRTIEALVRLPPVTLRAYLERYMVATDGLSEQSRRFALGRCVGINEQALRLRLGPL